MMRPTPLFLLAALVLLGGVLATAQTDLVDTLAHDGRARDYRLHLPPQYVPGGPALPLVLNLHGRGSNAFQQEAYSQMNAVADREGFAVAYPNGVNAEWNVGWSFGSRADDAGFLLRLVDSLQAAYGFDASRTYSCGMSNGGFMSYVLACRAPERLAAIGSVTGGMVPGMRAGCAPARAMPVMQIHGTADGVVAYGGSAINDPIETTVAFWTARNGCGAVPDTAAVPDLRDDGFTSTRYTYTACREGAEVQLIAVARGGHTWPGGIVDLGGTTYDFAASEELWGFFQRFRRDAASGALDVGLRQNTPHAGLVVGPNPWRAGPLHVALAGTAAGSPPVGGRLTLYDALGQNCGAWPVHGRSAIVYPSTDLPPGAYLLVGQWANTTAVGRLLVVGTGG